MRSIIIQQLPNGFEPLRGPIEISYRFIYQPKSTLKKWEKEILENAALPKATSPDADNLEKAVNDAMNGVVFEDDKLIWSHDTRKYYSSKGPSRIEVDVRYVHQKNVDLYKTYCFEELYSSLPFNH